MKLEKRKYQQGFSLIELMVVVVIIGVIVAVAIPSYNQYINETYRSDGFDKITEVMFQMERFKSKNRTYTVDLSDLGFAGVTIPSDDGYYTISAIACGSGIARCVNVRAIAQAAPQTSDTGCTTLTLNSQGVKTPAACW